MLYELALEPIKQSVTTSARNLGRAVPKQFVSGPELRWGLQLYYDAFTDLDTERSHGSGYTRIAWSDIIRYAVFYGFTDDQTARAIAHVFAMDTAFIKKMAADAEAKRQT